MDFSERTLFDGHFAMGIFALYVVAVSLVRIMADREFFRITQMKRVWGRKRGLVFHFLSNVALPLVCGVVFLTSGIAGTGQGTRIFSGEQGDHVGWTLKGAVEQDVGVDSFLQAFVEGLLDPKELGHWHDLHMP